MMNRSRHYAALTLGILALIGGTLALRAQPGDPVALAAQLTERYDLLALEDGLGLVPHDRDVGFRLIEVRDGGVALNGEIVTSGELRERLGPDADLILRVTYLTVAEQRGLAGTAGISATAGAAAGRAPRRTIPSRRRRRGREQPTATPCASAAASWWRAMNWSGATSS